MTQPKPKPLALRSHEVATLLKHGTATVVRNEAGVWEWHGEARRVKA